MHRASGTDPKMIASAVVLTKTILGIVKAVTDEKRIEEGVNAAIAKHISAMNDSQRKAFAPIAASAKAYMSMYNFPGFAIW